MLNVIVIRITALRCLARMFILEVQKIQQQPCWCGSVGWVLYRKIKGHQFGSQSGHTPGVQAKPPLGSTQEETISVPLPLSPFLSLSLKKKKKQKNNNYIQDVLISGSKTVTAFFSMVMSNHRHFTLDLIFMNFLFLNKLNLVGPKVVGYC